MKIITLRNTMLGLTLALWGTVHGMNMTLSQDTATVETVTVTLADGESTLLSSIFADLKNLSTLSEIICSKGGKVSFPSLTKEELDALTDNMSSIKAGPQSIEKMFEYQSQANKYRPMRALISAANYLGIESVMETYFAFLDKKITYLEKLNDSESMKRVFYRLVHPLGLIFSHEKQMKRIWFYFVKESGSPFLLEKFITEHGIEVDCKNDTGHTALEIAVENDRQDVAELLIKYGANVNAPCAMFDIPVLLTATLRGTHQGSGMVRSLLKAGALPDNMPINQDSELYHASCNGLTEIAELLLNHDALVDRHDTYSWTALMRAAQHGHTAVVELLLDRKASVDIPNSFGTTALTLACEGGHADSVVRLLAHGAQTEPKDTISNNTPLMSLMERREAEVVQGHPAVVTALLTHGACISNINKNGHTVVSLASQFGRADLLSLIFTTMSSKDAKNIRNRVMSLLLCMNRLKVVDNDGWEVVCQELEAQDQTGFWDMLRQIVAYVLGSTPKSSPDQTLKQIRKMVTAHIINMLVDERMQLLEHLLTLQTNNQTPVEIAAANNRDDVVVLLSNREAIRTDIESAYRRMLFPKK